MESPNEYEVPGPTSYWKVSPPPPPAPWTRRVALLQMVSQFLTVGW